MKTRTLISATVLSIVALALTVSAVGQSASVTWKIALHGANIRNTGTAEYFTNAQLFSKFSVDTTTPDLADGIKLDVFLGPSTSTNEPYGKLVGVIDVDGGFGAMVLSGARTPVVRKGTTVSIVQHDESSVVGERLVMKGTF
jgi:hypothetical protein